MKGTKPLPPRKGRRNVAERAQRKVTGRQEREIAKLIRENTALREALDGLLEIAKTAMPETYFQTDSRVQAARKLLDDSRESPLNRGNES